MKIKIKAFTITELLIVFMILGIIATLTLPSIFKQIDTANDKKTKINYLKALDNVNESITNWENKNGVPFSWHLAAYETRNDDYTLEGEVTSVASIKPSLRLKNIFKGYIEIKDYYCEGKGFKYSSCTDDKLWLNTEQNISYKFLDKDNLKEEKSCYNKNHILSNYDNREKESCAIILVDINGIGVKPDKIQENIEVNEKTTPWTLPKLEGDRFYIYVANDGAIAGPRNVITGYWSANRSE